MHGNVDVKMGSERNFGFVFAAVSAIIALAPLFRGHPPRVSFLILALAFAAVAIFAPGLLRWPNRLWFRFGMLLGAIVALSSVWATTLATQALAADVHWIVLVGTALLVGAACGLVNGVVIAYGKLVAFIATLAMLASARGLAEILAAGMRGEPVRPSRPTPPRPADYARLAGIAAAGAGAVAALAARGRKG